MKAAFLNTPLNATQLFVLQTFATTRSEQEKEDLTSFYLDYIQKKMDAKSYADTEKKEYEQLKTAFLNGSKYSMAQQINKYVS
ncbi:MAG: hypothetical protein FWF09_04495 [Bacteroidales bacterium]|nr:hypothetical protein [Bacteroidales bacterium]